MDFVKLSVLKFPDAALRLLPAHIEDVTPVFTRVDTQTQSIVSTMRRSRQDSSDHDNAVTDMATALPALTDERKKNMLKTSLNTAHLAQAYEQSKHAIELLGRDEESRRLRIKLLLLQHAVEELQDQLQDEQDYSSQVCSVLDDHLARAQQAETALASVEQQSRVQQSDMCRLQAEVNSLRSSTHDNSDLLTEKLALARELSTMRPELQHLRAQATSVEALVTEKLTLQRQLADARVEASSAKADAKRALAKRRDTTVEIAREEQLEDLKRQLAKEKRARLAAEEKDEQIVNEDVRKELAKEKRLREKLEKEVKKLKESDTTTELRVELSEVKNALLAAQAHANSNTSSPETNAAVAAMRVEMAQAAGKHATAQREAVKREEEWDIQRADFEEQLNRLHDKLKETNALLKTATEELANRDHTATESEEPPMTMEAAIVQCLPARSTRKRAANFVEPSNDETSLGTPGDQPQAKRARKTAAAIGSKSAFSITPYLNKTTVLDEEKQAESEAEISPTKPRTRKPLGEAESAKGNAVLRKKLAKASEEPVTIPVKLPASLSPVQPVQATTASGESEPPMTSKKPVRSKVKPRKSLVDFATFQKVDSEPVVKQKKRKLGGRGPTLFDEDDDAATLGSKSTFGNRSVFGMTPGNRLTSGKKASRTTLLSANDGSGFQFSPLRRNRPNIDDTLKA